MIGATLGHKYKLVRLLGRGGMGAVYEAERLDAPARVAVKILNTRLDPDTLVIERFRREARVAAAIPSDHVAQTLDAGTDEETGLPYLVMDLLQGEDLQHLLDRVGPIAPEAALCIAAQALLGLETAHAARVVHRDIKPANIFLAQGPGGAITVKLLDFGIAKVLADTLEQPGSKGLTATGGLLGSPLYMSPEQVESSRDVDQRSDIWSLGSTLYCALAGHAPHERLGAGSLPRLIYLISSRPPPPLAEVAPWVPLAIAQVVHGALTLDPDARYPTATAMLAALRPHLPDDLALRAEMLEPIRETRRAALAPTMAAETAPTIVAAPTVDAREKEGAAPRTLLLLPTQAAPAPNVDSPPEEPPQPLTGAAVTNPVAEAVAPPAPAPRRRLLAALVLVLAAAAAVLLALRSFPRLPPIAPFPEGTRGVVLAGPFFAGEEGRAFCQELREFDTWQAVRCLDVAAGEREGEELQQRARGAKALLFGLVDREGHARVSPLGQLEEHELLGRAVEVDLGRRVDWPRIRVVLGAMARMAAPQVDAAPPYACPPLPPGDVDRLGLLELLLVPACAAHPLDSQRLLAVCRARSDSDDCALARYLYADRCPSCPDTREILRGLRDEGPERLRPLSALMLARAACNAGELGEASQALLALTTERAPCTRAALPEVAACIVAGSKGAPLERRIAELEAQPVDAEERCPAEVRATILARRGYYRARGRDWARAEADFAQAYRLSHAPLDALRLAEVLLHQGRTAEAKARLAGLEPMHLEGPSQFYAALLRWIAARDGGAQASGAAEAEALMVAYWSLGPGKTALEGGPDPDLRALACPAPAGAECVYDLLSRPKAEGAEERLRLALRGTAQAVPAQGQGNIK